MGVEESVIEFGERGGDGGLAERTDRPQDDCGASNNPKFRIPTRTVEFRRSMSRGAMRPPEGGVQYEGRGR